MNEVDSQRDRETPESERAREGEGEPGREMGGGPCCLGSITRNLIIFQIRRLFEFRNCVLIVRGLRARAEHAMATSKGRARAAPLPWFLRVLLALLLERPPFMCVAAAACVHLYRVWSF
jgi:hypothetical protein